MMNPAAMVITRPLSVQRRSQSAINPPTSVPTTPATSPQVPSSSAAAALVSPNLRVMNDGPQPTSPLVPNEIIAPERKMKISVGVRSTMRAGARQVFHGILEFGVNGVSSRRSVVHQPHPAPDGEHRPEADRDGEHDGVAAATRYRTGCVSTNAAIRPMPVSTSTGNSWWTSAQHAEAEFPGQVANAVGLLLPGRIDQPHHQRRACESRNPHRHERHAPAVDALEVAAEQDAEHAADRDAGVEDSHREGAMPAGEVVGHHRRRSRRIRRFADADRRAADEQLR